MNRWLTRFDHIDDGRSRVYQTANMVILYLNTPMKSDVNPNQRVYGICNKRSNAILLKGQYGKTSGQKTALKQPPFTRLNVHVIRNLNFPL